MRLNLRGDPQREWAVSIALERAVVTLLVITAALSGGLLYGFRIFEYAKQFAAMMQFVVR